MDQPSSSGEPTAEGGGAGAAPWGGPSTSGPSGWESPSSPPTGGPSTGGEPPVRPTWLDEPRVPPTEPPVGPPVWGAASASSPMPSAAGRKSNVSWWKPALLGGLVGALVAAAVAGGIVAAAVDDDTVARPTTVPAQKDDPARPASTLGGMGLDVAGVLDVVEPAVVSIEVRTSDGRDGAGSGMVIREDGLVLTNAHVVDGAAEIQVNLPDGTTSPAKLVGSIPTQDVAVVKIDDAAGLATVELGDSSALVVGDEVVAVGNALGLGDTPTVTTGIVSALDRSIPAETGVTLNDLVQTDAAINPGNSGGPLLNVNGEVVGVNTAIAGGAENIGFAIAIDAVEPLIEGIIAGREIGFLGVSTGDIEDVNPDLLRRSGVESDAGAFVSQVTSGSGADEAGIRPGDVIVEVNGEPVETAADVSDLVGALEPGTEVQLGYEREGEVEDTTATLSERPDDGG